MPERRAARTASRFGDDRAATGTAYFSGLLGVAASRGLSLVAGVLSLWLLTRLLETPDFAAYSVAMTLFLLLGHAAVFGLDKAIVLRIGAVEPDPARLIGAGLVRKAGGWVLALSIAAAALAIAAWTWLPGLSSEAPVRDWLVRLWPIVPATGLTLVLMNWYHANHVFGLPQGMWGAADALRCAGFVCAALAGLGPPAVAASAVFGAALPVAVLGLRALGHTRREPAGLGLSDAAHGVRFMAMRLSAMGITHIDILFLGALAPAQSVAQYAVASRFALLIEVGQGLFREVYMPRARRHVTAGHLDKAVREYDVIRVLGLVFILPVLAGFILAGEALLGWFGSFGTAFPAFLLLAAAQLAHVGVGMHSWHLSMTGHLGWAVANRVAAFLLLALLLPILIPAYGPTGAGMAFLLAVLVYNAVGAVLAYRTQRMVLLTPDITLCWAVAAAATLTVAAAPALAPAGAAGVLASGAALALRHAGLIRTVAAEARLLLAR